jgi:hypothetical protein
MGDAHEIFAIPEGHVRHQSVGTPVEIFRGVFGNVNNQSIPASFWAEQAFYEFAEWFKQFCEQDAVRLFEPNSTDGHFGARITLIRNAESADQRAVLRESFVSRGEIPPIADGARQDHRSDGRTSQHRTEIRGALSSVIDRLNARTPADGPLQVIAFFCHGDHTWTNIHFTTREIDAFIAAIAGGGSQIPEARATRNLRVVLYACLTGSDPPAQQAHGAHGAHAAPATTASASGSHSLAGQLCLALKRAGIDHAQVDGHTESGHAVRNSTTRRFLATAPEGRTAVPADQVFIETLLGPRGMSPADRFAMSPPLNANPPVYSFDALLHTWSAMMHEAGQPVQHPSGPTDHPSRIWLRFPFMTIGQIRAEIAQVLEARSAHQEASQSHHHHPSHAR